MMPVNMGFLAPYSSIYPHFYQHLYIGFYQGLNQDPRRSQDIRFIPEFAGSGSMRLEGFNGELRSNTGSGDVRVTGTKGEIKLNTGSGDIDITDASGSISANVGSGSIDARGITVADASSFNSGSGDVDVELATSPKADISVNSGSGDATLDFDGNEIAGLVVMKANKRNGNISAPFDFDKTEEEDNRGNQVVIKKTAQRGISDVKIKIGTGSGTARITE